MGVAMSDFGSQRRLLRLPRYVASARSRGWSFEYTGQSASDVALTRCKPPSAAAGEAFAGPATGES